MNVKKKNVIDLSQILGVKQRFEDQIFERNIEETEFATKEDIIFKDCIFKGISSFKNIKAREIHFYNCIFERETFLFDCSLLIFGITDCKFTKGIYFLSNQIRTYFTVTNIKTPLLSIDGDYQNIQIISCKVDKLNIENLNKDYVYKKSSIKFLKSNEISQLRFECKLCNTSVVFRDGIFDSIWFEGTFNNLINFEHIQECKNLFFESSNFNNRIDFNEGTFEQIHFNRSNFQKLIVFRGFNYLDKAPYDLNIQKLSLHSCQFENNISISIIDLEWFDLSNNNFKQLLNLNCYFQYHHTEKKTNIGLRGLNQGNIIIENIYTDISLSDLNYGNVHFRNLDIETIDIDEFHNQGSVSFTKLDYKGWLIINKSIVGDLNFFNTNLNKLEEVIISDSNIDGLKLSLYPKKIKSYSNYSHLGYGLEDKSQNHKNLKSVYNQLKQIAKKNGDIDTFSKYQSLEYKELLLTKRLSVDSILLGFNWISNNNGNSWLRGVIFTLSIAFVFFLLYLNILRQSIFVPELYKDYVLYIGSFPKMYLEKYNPLNNLWNVTLIIWLSKIFISYGIYQTISAFRKYGKK